MRSVIVLSVIVCVAISVSIPEINPELPQLPAANGAVFKITSYGAKADGSTDNTNAIQKAIDAAAANHGGGTVLIPSGSSAYLTGPLTVKSGINIEVQSGATLQALPYGKYAANSSKFPNLFSGSNVQDVSFTGSGTIDGNGAKWWSLSSQLPHRPRLIELSGTRILVSGIRLTNSPMMHLVITGNEVTVQDLTIEADANSPNTDGIDVAGKNIVVRRCTVAVGDDDICLKPGVAFCSNVLFEDCIVGSGHGVSIGGQSNDGVDGFYVRNITMTGTTNGVRFKADQTQGGIVQNVVFQDVHMTNVQYPIAGWSYYKWYGTPGGKNVSPQLVESLNEKPLASLNVATVPQWKDITFESITSTGSKGYNVLWGLPTPDALISNVVFNGVTVSGSKGMQVYDCSGVSFVNSDLGQLTQYNSIVFESVASSEVVRKGGQVSLKCTVNSSGAGSYFWVKDGKTLTDGTLSDGTKVSGSNAATLSLANAGSAAAGSYACGVSAALDSFDVKAGKLIKGGYQASATSAATQITIN